ncbi:hypothetical protein D3C71_27600 [compost metagenome]
MFKNNQKSQNILKIKHQHTYPFLIQRTLKMFPFAFLGRTIIMALKTNMPRFVLRIFSDTPPVTNKYRSQKRLF